MYSDSDIVIYKDPLAYILKLDFNYMIFQRDKTICTGFFYIRACEKSLLLLTHALKDLKMNKIGDQRSMIATYAYFKIQPNLLPDDLFSSGKVFFEKYQYSWDLNIQNIYMMHNNWVRGRVCKRLRMLELGYINSTRDNEVTKYITANSMSFDALALRKQLTTLVNIANQLGRVLIIPPIPCDIGKGYCTIANRELDSCYSDLLSNITYGYRESSFIGKANIPNTLKNSLSNQKFIAFIDNCNKTNETVLDFPPRRKYSSEIVCYQCLLSFDECVINYSINKMDTTLISIIFS